MINLEKDKHLLKQKMNLTVFKKKKKKRNSLVSGKGCLRTAGGWGWLNLLCLALLDARSHYNWLGFGQFPSKLPLLYKNTCCRIKAIGAYSQEMGGQEMNVVREKNRTIARYFISSLSLMKTYLYSSRPLVHNIHTADLILNLATKTFMRHAIAFPPAT